MHWVKLAQHHLHTTRTLFRRSLFIHRCVSVGVMSDAIKKGLRGCARCVVPGVSAAVAIATWLGRALAVGVRKLLGGLNV